MRQNSIIQLWPSKIFQEATGRYVVLYNYTAQDENDLTVERGQCVTVLNSDDPDWFWVSQFDGRDGFVPSGFIYPLDAIQRQQSEFIIFFEVQKHYVTLFTYLIISIYF